MQVELQLGQLVIQRPGPFAAHKLPTGIEAQRQAYQLLQRAIAELANQAVSLSFHHEDVLATQPCSRHCIGHAVVCI